MTGPTPADLEHPRFAFLGTPDFASVHLEALLSHGYRPVVVITQPDRASGRTRKITPSPVKQVAAKHGLETTQPERIRKRAVIDWYAGLGLDLAVVVAYGQVLATRFIEAPRLGSYNVHASLLPRWRGAAPIQAAIMAGDTVTGCSIQRLVHRLDAGPVIARRESPIQPEDTAETLFDRLARCGADLLIETLPRILRGEVTEAAQDEARATYAPPLHKTDGHVEWDCPPLEVTNRVRALCPWPGAWVVAYPREDVPAAVRGTVSLKPRRFRICHSVPVEGDPEGIDGTALDAFTMPGTVAGVGKDAFYVRVGDGGLIAVDVVQPEGKGQMPVSAFLAGYHLLPGSRLE